tara:strand:+ start:31258 stop:31761 length:504 start_codon:yes stop_codon:yes gene_type:complete
MTDLIRQIEIPTHGGGDPEAQNDIRRKRAGNAITRFQEASGADLEDALSDLLCDLMHWSHYQDMNFADELARACMHFREETLQTEEAEASQGEEQDVAEATEAGTRGGALTAQELATILAALRFYQQCGMGNPENRSAPIHDIATDGGTILDLDGDEIDQLCEKLNT